MVKIPRSRACSVETAWDSWPHAAETGNPRSDQETEAGRQSRGSSLPTPAWAYIVFAGKEKTALGILSAVPKDTISKGRKEKKEKGVTVCFLI